eukprot:scaffold915_cov55-Isochrysis_galbana.AAC.2
MDASFPSSICIPPRLGTSSLPLRYLPRCQALDDPPPPFSGILLPLPGPARVSPPFRPWASLPPPPLPVSCSPGQVLDESPPADEEESSLGGQLVGLLHYYGLVFEPASLGIAVGANNRRGGFVHRVSRLHPCMHLPHGGACGGVAGVPPTGGMKPGPQKTPPPQAPPPPPPPQCPVLPATHVPVTLTTPLAQVASIPTPTPPAKA